MEYSYRIYEIYLKYVSKDDIHVYSIDEAFLDITPYIKLYKKNPKEIAIMIMDDIFKTTRITATCGIGTNMYLSKIALDIISKHVKSNIGFLNEKLYKEKLWHHTPLSDFWQIGVGIENRLHKMHIKDMYDISVANENKLYKEFGKDYNYKDAKVILVEMIDNLVLRLVSKNLYTNVVGFSIGYSKNIIDKTKFSKKLDNPTNSFIKIKNILLEEYDLLINEKTFIRKISIWFSGLTNKKIEQLNMFDNNNYNDEDKLERALNNLKLRYGKNVILRGISYTESGTQLLRNKLIGGHNAE